MGLGMGVSRGGTKGSGRYRAEARKGRDELRPFSATSASRRLCLLRREKHAGDPSEREGGAAANQDPPRPGDPSTQPEIEFHRETAQHADDCAQLVCSLREDAEKEDA